jgi:septum site-determining protein MinC
VRHLREARRAEARAAGLGAIRGSGRKPKKAKPADEAEAPGAEPVAEERRAGVDRRGEGASHAVASLPSLLLRTPLRSGQVVYAEQRDAVVLAAINAGAELIADGNIHVYGALRGRALAGAHGDEDARIFTKSLEADLVAIAGCYLSSDEIPEAKRGKPAQIFLEGGKIVIADV